MKKKTYTLRPTSKQLKEMKILWDILQIQKNVFDSEVRELERVMEERTGIKGIEFFMCDNSFVGIGNSDRTMLLIHDFELEKK